MMSLHKFNMAAVSILYSEKWLISTSAQLQKDNGYRHVNAKFRVHILNYAKYTVPSKFNAGLMRTLLVLHILQKVFDDCYVKLC